MSLGSRLWLCHVQEKKIWNKVQRRAMVDTAMSLPPVIQGSVAPTCLSHLHFMETSLLNAGSAMFIVGLGPQVSALCFGVQAQQKFIHHARQGTKCKNILGGAHFCTLHPAMHIVYASYKFERVGAELWHPLWYHTKWQK